MSIKKYLLHKTHRGDMRNIILLPIFLAIAAILGGSIFLTGVGLFANKTSTNSNISNVCKNCQSSTRTMLTTTELMFPLSFLLAIIGGAVAGIFVIKSRR